ncbi:hypothetical protein Forpe1208_v016674 [Fusarium oxysporum f. sp. rapae]|uniref:Uncharacterized protein n=1 Tax=Fusarium oxysporum f. sp. rapae TaxID=485398 RepID=A0A8J5TXN8_FUSOX|nr:hypothetical protein Forpe1208_v016674 [Fusarium oxysporum f. sp. rapae]
MRVEFLVLATAVTTAAAKDHSRHNCCTQTYKDGRRFYDQDLTVNTCKRFYGNRADVVDGTCKQRSGINIDGDDFNSHCQIEGYDYMGYTDYRIGAGYRGSC